MILWNFQLTYANSGYYDGSPRNGRPVFTSQTLPDEGHTEQYHCVRGGDYLGLWLDDRGGIVIIYPSQCGSYFIVLDTM